jgi:hypothetical protein
MLRFAVDEDFDNRIVRGLLRLLPTLDVVRVQDVCSANEILTSWNGRPTKTESF